MFFANAEFNLYVSNTSRNVIGLQIAIVKAAGHDIIMNDLRNFSFVEATFCDLWDYCVPDAELRRLLEFLHRVTETVIYQGCGMHGTVGIKRSLTIDLGSMFQLGNFQDILSPAGCLGPEEIVESVKKLVQIAHTGCLRGSLEVSMKWRRCVLSDVHEEGLKVFCMECGAGVREDRTVVEAKKNMVSVRTGKPPESGPTSKDDEPIAAKQLQHGGTLEDQT